MWHVISNGPTSTPRSPRATMMPSDASRISSKLMTPSCDSIFEMTCGRTMSGAGVPDAARSLRTMSQHRLRTREASPLVRAWRGGGGGRGREGAARMRTTVVNANVMDGCSHLIRRRSRCPPNAETRTAPTAPAWRRRTRRHAIESTTRVKSGLQLHPWQRAACLRLRHHTTRSTRAAAMMTTTTTTPTTARTTKTQRRCTFPARRRTFRRRRFRRRGSERCDATLCHDLRYSRIRWREKKLNPRYLVPHTSRYATTERTSDALRTKLAAT